MKKLSLLLVFGLSVLSVAADEYIDSLTKVVYSYNPGSGVAMVKEGTCNWIDKTHIEYFSGSPDAKGEISILERFSVDGQEYIVNKVGNKAFAHNENITAVSFPSSVKDILDEAFYGCSSLTSVSFSEGLEYLGSEAFVYCSISSVELPKGNLYVAGGAFSQCNRLKSIWIPSEISYLPPSAFIFCDSLTTIVVDEESKNYDSRDGCNAIIVQPSAEQLNYMLEWTPEEYQEELISQWKKGILYMGCGGTVIPPGIGTINEEAFYCCTSLKGEMVIPEPVEVIEALAFYRCSGLTHVTLPNTLRAIYNAAFAFTSLESVTIPPGVTDIRRLAFHGIPTLTSITSLIEEPFNLTEPICDEETYSHTTLYVPAGTKKKYTAAGWTDFRRIVELEKPSIGDANGDGNLTVADMTAIAHHVLGNTPEGFSPKAADANQDGQVNVADYTAVAHLLLYGSIERPAGCREYESTDVLARNDVAEPENTVYIAPVKVTAGEETLLSVCLKNSVDAEGFQFTLTLPEGVSVVRDDEGFAEASLNTERTTKDGINTFATSLLPDGTLKVLAASTNGSAISAGDGEVCTIKVHVDADMAEGDYTLQLSDVAISDANAQSHDVALVEATLTVNEASGISATLNDQGETINEPFFDLQGRRMDSSIFNSHSSIQKKGVYINGGKKYVR